MNNFSATTLEAVDSGLLGIQTKSTFSRADQLKEKPEILHPGKFKLSEAKEIAIACSDLLSSVEDLKLSSMRLELYYDKDAQYWKLILKIDPVIWYDRILGKDKLDIALSYTRVEKEIIAQEIVSESEDQSKDEIEIASEDHCKHQTECTYAKAQKDGRFACSSGLHDSIVCTAELQRNGGLKDKPCNWYLEEILCIRGKNDFFLLTARRFEHRDLLLLPNPSIISDGWKQHYPNRDLSKMPFFWQQVYKNILYLKKNQTENGKDEIPQDEDVFGIVCKISLNFGLWEKGQAKDQNSKDCHGHAHLELTLEAVNDLIETGEFKMLEGRRQRPENYREINVAELEQKRLFSEMLWALKKDIADMKTDIADMKTAKNELKK